VHTLRKLRVHFPSYYSDLAGQVKWVQTMSKWIQIIHRKKARDISHLTRLRPISLNSQTTPYFHSAVAISRGPRVEGWDVKPTTLPAKDVGITTANTMKTVRFEQHQMVQLERIAAEQKRSIPDVVRSAIDAFLIDEKTRADSDLRHLRVSEYMQICLDWIIQQDYPEVRDKMIAQCDQRMRQYHSVRWASMTSVIGAGLTLWRSQKGI
jgi:hypothetical protein